MTTRTIHRMRPSPIAIAAAIGLPLLAVVAMQAFGQDDPVDAGGDTPSFEYRILLEEETIFVSVERAADFLYELGNDGWIVPDGAQLITHVFDPGTLDQHTRFLLRPAGPWDEELRHVILRREVR